MNFRVESGGVKELELGGGGGGGGCFSLYFWKRCRDKLILLGKLVDLG